MRRFPIQLASALLGALLCLAACAPTSTATVSVPPTATTPPAPTAPAGFPTLTAENGWHVVLTLGNVFSKPVNVEGHFVATKPYRLRLVCAGSGQLLQVDYAAGGVSTLCNERPEQNETGDSPPPPGDGQVTVHVSTEGAFSFAWEVVAEMQD